MAGAVAESWFNSSGGLDRLNPMFYPRVGSWNGNIYVGKPGYLNLAANNHGFWLRCSEDHVFKPHILRFPSDSSTKSGMEVEFFAGDVSEIPGKDVGTVNPAFHDPPVYWGGSILIACCHLNLGGFP